MKIEISETDHARLAALAEARGETDLSVLVDDALSSYLDAPNGGAAARRQAPKGRRWEQVARFHQENPSLNGKSEQLNELIREFREEFAV